MRINWLDENTDVPALEEHVAKLQHFTDSMADGIIDDEELNKQNEALATAMRAVQDDLTDEQHKKVTTLLVETMAFSIMSTLHGLAASRQQETSVG